MKSNFLPQSAFHVLAAQYSDQLFNGTYLTTSSLVNGSEVEPIFEITVQ